MKRSKKPRPSASLTPHDAVVLAIDPGASSGWAIFDRGQLVTCGHTLTHEERAAACILAELTAGGRGERAGAPLVVVAEKWTASRSAARARRMNARTIEGLGKAWGLWLAAIESELEVPRRRILRVAQSTWKAKVLGRNNLPHAETVRAMAAVATRAGAKPGAIEDVYAAVCIGIWAAKAGEVALALPKPRAPRTARKEARAA